MRAAWQLSSISSCSVFKSLLPFFLLAALLFAWTFTYVRVPELRAAVDGKIAELHAALPRDVQAQGSALWHTIVQPWVLQRVRCCSACLCLLGLRMGVFLRSWCPCGHAHIRFAFGC